MVCLGNKHNKKLSNLLKYMQYSGIQTTKYFRPGIPLLFSDHKCSTALASFLFQRPIQQYIGKRELFTLPLFLCKYPQINDLKSCMHVAVREHVWRRKEGMEMWSQLKVEKLSLCCKRRWACSRNHISEDAMMVPGYTV